MVRDQRRGGGNVEGRARHRIVCASALELVTAHLRQGRGDAAGQGVRKLSDALERAFAADGLLAAKIPGFKRRAQQPEDAPVWAHASSTRENCLGQECPDYSDCFVMRARRNALAADVVVVNHHLFFADVVLRDEGVAELLPSCNTVIFDEAHQLPETARNFFGERISTTQIVELARDARGELRAAGGGSPELEALCNRVEKAARDLRLALGERPSRLPWPQALA